MSNSTAIATRVSYEGNFDPDSIREIWAADTPTLRPNSACDHPRESRADWTCAPNTDSTIRTPEGRYPTGTVARTREARQGVPMGEQDRRSGDPQLGAELRSVREEAGLSQDQLAAKLGLTRTQVSRIETGARSTGIDVVRRWYRECGYELDAAQVGTPEQATSLALAVAHLPEGQLDAVIAVVRAWPRLSERARGRILGIADTHEA